MLIAVGLYGVVLCFFISTIDDTSYADVAQAISDHPATDISNYLPDHQLQVVLSWVVMIVRRTTTTTTTNPTTPTNPTSLLIPIRSSCRG